jgi:all-trans-8'-apo-beta-carotenal 15,15'-oxygenase
MTKNNLAMIGWNDYDWIKGGFSAHPKVDPDTGDIFNIGTDFEKATVTISQSDMNMKLKQSTNFKLRKLQSIHDFCLAGDYMVIF